MKNIYLVSLGCPKNLVDSEVMLGLLEEAGYQLVQEAERANLLMVNTCGFINSAVEEAVDEILTLTEFKKEDPSKQIVVAGCLVQRYGKDLREELPEVDLFVGTESIKSIVALLEDNKKGTNPTFAVSHDPFLMDSAVPRKLATPSHRAYLKITEGCANRCSYCMIPSIRGPLRSRAIADLIQESKRLATAGIKELTLIAQDLLAFGQDKGRSFDLGALLAGLLDSCNIPWIRLLYLHPARLNKDFLKFIADNPRILPYLDIPIQHVSDRILKLMARPYDRNHLERLIADIRDILPGAALRTTLMVGFPGEKESDLNEMIDFLEQHRFNHVGVFAYSNEKDCRAAKLPGHCEDVVKQQRLEKIMGIQAAISYDRLQKYIGREENVLIEGISKETDLLLEGRTWFQGPEIDGCVYITSGQIKPGAIVRTRITDAHYYDLVGELVIEELPDV